jgi:ABC-2 type transport system ATP-binding protein
VQHVLEVEGLTKSFGDTRALAGVELTVGKGEVVGLLGPNGAGKTTLVRILATLDRPDGGRAAISGFDVCGDAAAVRHLIGLAGQFASVEEKMTGRENLEMVGRLYQLPAAEARQRATTVLERLDLLDAADRPVQTYSGGMRRRIDLGASLVGDPQILLLDEPTTGLDPRSRSQVWDFVSELAAEGTSVLLTTQYLEEADALADRIVVIDRGVVIAEGSPLDLKRRIGQDMLELTVLDADYLPSAAAALDGVGTDAPQLDIAARRLTLPLADGVGGLAEAVRRLDGSDVKIVDIAVRRPSLDDVFLAITGHHAVEEADGDDTQDATRERKSA